METGLLQASSGVLAGRDGGQDAGPGREAVSLPEHPVLPGAGPYGRPGRVSPKQRVQRREKPGCLTGGPGLAHCVLEHVASITASARRNRFDSGLSIQCVHMYRH